MARDVGTGNGRWATIPWAHPDPSPPVGALARRRTVLPADNVQVSVRTDERWRRAVVGLRWRPGIGDPTFVGWLTVAAYGIAAAGAVWAFAGARASQRRLAGEDQRAARDRRSMKQLWLLIAITMVLLGANKQLDLQTLLIQKIRQRAYVDGWYGDRRRYQVDFIVAMTLAALLAGVALSVWLRRSLARMALAIAGLGMLVLFVLIRASSFHYVDKLLSLGEGLRLNAVFELSGIALVIGAAVQWQRVERRQFADGPGLPEMERTPSTMV